MYSAHPKYRTYVDYILITFVLTLSILTVFTAYKGMFLDSIDLHTHLDWAADFYLSYSSGWVYPRWAFDANFGLGEPVFIQLGPIYGILISIFQTIFESTWGALRAYILFIIILTFFVVWFIANKEGVKHSMLISTVIALNPIIMFLAFRQSAYPWLASVPFLLLTLYYSYRTFDLNKTWVNFPLVIFCALFISTHPLSAFLLFTSVMLGYGLYCIIHVLRKKNLDIQFIDMCRLGLNYALSILLVSAFVIPAIFKMQYINSGELINQLDFNISSGFILPMISQFYYPIRWFLVNWVFGALTVICFAIFIQRYVKNQKGKLLFMASLGGCILASEISFPLWKSVSAMSFVQWPFRYIYISLFSTMIYLLITQNKSKNNFTSHFTMLLLISLSLLLALQNTTMNPIEIKERLSKQYVGHPAFLPKNVEKGAVQRYFDENTIQPTRVISKNSVNFTYEKVALPNGKQINLPLMNYPNWEVYSEGKLINHTTSKYGTIQFSSLNKSTSFDVKWKYLVEDKLGVWVSVLTALFLLIIFIRNKLSIQRISA